MARKAITAVFKTQNDAYDAANEIKALDKDQVTVRQGALVTKDARGNVTMPDTQGADVPWGTIGGPIVGGLLGLLAGPAGASVGAAGGAAIGATTGLMTGWTADLVRLGLDDDMVQSVSSEIYPGESALIAEIDEGSTEPVDRIVARHHGRIYRSDVWS